MARSGMIIGEAPLEIIVNKRYFRTKDFKLRGRAECPGPRARRLYIPGGL
jgi:hypothetical protein